MVSKKIALALGLLVLITAITTSCVMFTAEKKQPQMLVISTDNLVEIEEGAQLDAYGFDRFSSEVTEARVKRNESLYLILRKLGVSNRTIYEINQAADGIFQSHRIRPGQQYLTYRDMQSGEAERLVLHQDPLNYVIIDWEKEIEITRGEKRVETRLATSAGEIKSSLYETLIEQDDQWILANHLSEIFAWQVDFFRIYPGDSYKVLYEEQYLDEKPYGVGKVLAAEFTHKGETFDAYYYETENRAGYYDDEGNGVQKALLKAPFRFSHRISSGFSHSRFHPVTKQRVPHYGVDYAAPLGTPVLSVGDGEIIEAQYRGANGNIVKVRHNSTYTTAYLHLNGFAKGIRPGTRVKQGEVIGFVGRTGRVTGVHLDYRIYKHGRPVNPLTVKLPPSKAIDEEEMPAFREHIKSLKQQLEQQKRSGASDSEESIASL